MQKKVDDIASPIFKIGYQSNYYNLNAKTTRKMYFKGIQKNLNFLDKNIFHQEVNKFNNIIK